MAKKTLVKNQDQFLVRLPDGMRDRIKAKADRAGMSMNEAIVWCLDAYFPAPTAIEEKLDELVAMVAILKGDNTYEGVDQLVSAVHDAIKDVKKGNFKTAPNFRKAVSDRFEEWEAEWAESQRYRLENPFDDELWGPTPDNDRPSGGGTKPKKD
ncbi:Arc family DNA-binding protein [Mesorhizobium loti]|nr:Arc family DNA-binding protein [Mesorhizobium loti]